MRHLFFRRVIAIALLGGGMMWVSGDARSPSFATMRVTIAGGEWIVQQRGRGPGVLLISDDGNISVLAAKLAEQQRHVMMTTSALFAATGPAGTREFFERLRLDEGAVVVGTASVLARFAGQIAMASLPAVRFAVLDFGNAQVDDTDFEGIIAPDTAISIVATSSSASWTHFRRASPKPRVHFTLVQDCGSGFTIDCVNEVTPFITALATAPSTPTTGEVVRDVVAPESFAPAMVVVPNGQFREGGRSIHLLHRLAVARTETTVSEFRRFVEATGHSPEKGCWYHTADQEWKHDDHATWSSPPFAQADAHPVTCITFEDAEAYAAWVSAHTGRRYRLPTEMEFAFVNRSGRPGDYGVEAFTSQQLCLAANGADQASGLAYANHCNDGYAATAPVATFRANDFGLHDTTGNLWELTADCWRSNYLVVFTNVLGISPADGTARVVGTCRALHTVRGGSFISSPANLRADYRDREGFRSSRIGFRLVRELP